MAVPQRKPSGKRKISFVKLEPLLCGSSKLPLSSDGTTGLMFESRPPGVVADLSARIAGNSGWLARTAKANHAHQNKKRHPDSGNRIDLEFAGRPRNQTGSAGDHPTERTEGGK